MESARDAALGRAEKAEDRTLRLTKQVTLLEAENTKMSAELKTMKTAYNLETSKLEETLGEKENASDSIKKEYLDLRRKYDDVVSENRKESEQRSRIRDELKRCRDIAHDTASSFVSEKENLQEQVSSMAKMLSSYEVQLKQKESLLEVIKSQRSELSEELKKYRDDVTLFSNAYKTSGTENISDIIKQTPLSFNHLGGHNRTPGVEGTLNARLATTTHGHTFHSHVDMTSRDVVSGYSSQLKHLTQSIAQMDIADSSEIFDSSLNIHGEDVSRNGYLSFR